MSFISVQNLSISFADKPLFSGASFNVEERDKVGLIGRNGAGKTTFFKILTGELEPSEGSVFISSKAKIGVVEQHACRDLKRSTKEETTSVFENLILLENELKRIHNLIDKKEGDLDGLILKQSELYEKFQNGGGLTFRSRVNSMLKGLGFSESEINLPTGDLSGGQRTKISLGKLLLSDANLILLDEPTNHLDIKSCEWLEDYILKYAGTAIIISHDRYFLDKTTNKTMEIENKKITVGKGSYKTFSRLKAEREESLRREYEKKQKEIERLEGIIEQQKRFNRAKNYITIASRQKEIDRIKSETVSPPKNIREVKLSFSCKTESGNDVLTARGLSKSYLGKVLFKDVSFDIRKGERVFILGENGSGKTTLLKTVLGKIRPDSGYCRVGANVVIGYFDQISSSVLSENSVIEELYNKFPGAEISELRGKLGAFGFKDDEILKKMKDLSGGERARISLLELMLRKPNFLVLDEPTNHLDISGREALEDALKDYKGTILAVTHDRFLVNKLATRIFIMAGDEIILKDGSYDDYINSLENNEKQKKPEKKPNEYKLRKEQESLERRRAGEIRRLEERIENLENKKSEIEQELSRPDAASDYQKLMELTDNLNDINSELSSLYERWESVSDLNDKNA